MAGLGKYNISSYIDDLIPEHVQTLYPDLVAFLKVYALYLERSNKSGFYLNALDIQRDIDFVEDSLLTELQNEIGIAVPRDFATNPRMFYKRLIEFYRSRGTPESITSFFRMIYDDDVETYFPFVDLLEPSDGDWTDQSTDIIANQTNYTAWNVFTISGTPTVVSGNNDAGTAISSSFETGAPPPMGADVRMRWLYARHYFDAQSSAYDVQVVQQSPKINGVTQALNMGESFATLGSFTIGTSKLAGANQALYGDTDLQGYDNSTQLKYTNNASDEPFVFRRVNLQYKPVGRLRRRKIVGVE